MKRSDLQPTELLDYRHPAIEQLIAGHGWRELGERERIAAIYRYCRDEVPLGYNASDDIPASAVLADGYGQNTKATLLMALLRRSVRSRFRTDAALPTGTSQTPAPADVRL